MPSGLSVSPAIAANSVLRLVRGCLLRPLGFDGSPAEFACPAMTRQLQDRFAVENNDPGIGSGSHDHMFAFFESCLRLSQASAGKTESDLERCILVCSLNILEKDLF